MRKLMKLEKYTVIISLKAICLLIPVNDVIFLLLCNRFSLLKGRGKEKPLLLRKHYNSKQMNPGGMSHLSCQGPAGLQCCCCSLPHLRTRTNSGQQQTIALGCEPLEGNEAHTLPRSFKDSWQQQRRFGSSVLFLGIISCPARKASACCLVPLCICPRPISTLHPCPGQTRTEAPLPSFSPWSPPPSLLTLILPPYDGSLESLFS